MENKISIVIPAKNEAKSLAKLLPEIKSLLPGAEIVVVNDGSTDNTAELIKGMDVKCVEHEYSLGNGAAIKAGARAAGGEVIVFMDGDGQHRPEQIHMLVDEINKGADLAIGARRRDGQASIGRSIANSFYNWFASTVTGFRISDLTSGFRAVKARKFRQFLSLLPNGFSYPTTSTMAFLRSGYKVKFVFVDVKKREGKSHIKPLRDGLRFLIIIFKIATLYSPLKVFVPIAALTFSLGLARYAYTYMVAGVFTNMSALLMVAGVQIFLIGLVSEQITALIYKDQK